MECESGCAGIPTPGRLQGGWVGRWIFPLWTNNNVLFLRWTNTNVVFPLWRTATNKGHRSFLGTLLGLVRDTNSTRNIRTLGQKH